MANVVHLPARWSTFPTSVSWNYYSLGLIKGRWLTARSFSKNSRCRSMWAISASFLAWRRAEATISMFLACHLIGRGRGTGSPSWCRHLLFASDLESVAWGGFVFSLTPELHKQQSIAGSIAPRSRPRPPQLAFLLPTCCMVIHYSVSQFSSSVLSLLFLPSSPPLPSPLLPFPRAAYLSNADAASDVSGIS